MSVNNDFKKMNTHRDSVEYTSRYYSLFVRYIWKCHETTRLTLLLVLLIGGMQVTLNADTNQLINSGAFKPESRDEIPKVDLVHAQPRLLEYNVLLPPPSEKELNTLGSSNRMGPLKLGFHRTIPDHYMGDLGSNLSWTKIGDEIVSYFRIRSPEAQSIRFLAELNLPANATIAFYEILDDGKTNVIESITVPKKGFNEKDYWTPDAMGESIGVELRLPSQDARHDVEIVLLKIAHRIDQFDLNRTAVLECSNHEDIQCAIDDEEIEAGSATTTLMLLFESDGLTYGCSGTILNVSGDGDGVFHPYIITAAHCISTTAEASSVTAYFNYQAQDCDSSSLSSEYTPVFGGADLLATRQSYDQTLIRLNNDAPDGIWLSGWSTYDVSFGDTGFGGHHPDLGFKKFFSGSSRGNQNISVCDDGEDCVTLYDAIELRFDNGASEGGSSGSGLRVEFPEREGSYFVGVLSASDDKCVRGSAYFGEFRHFYPYITEWFDPEPVSDGDDHGDSRTTATLVSVNSTTNGELEESGDEDYFQIEVDRFGTLKVYTESSIDTTGELTSADDSLLVSDDDSGSSFNFSITQDLDPGTYYIKVEGYGSTTGDYTLHIEFEESDDHGDTRATATTIASSARNWDFSTVAQLEESDDIDVFELTLSQSRTNLKIYTVGTTDTTGLLVNSLGRTILENDDTDDDNTNFYLSGKLNKGTYYLYVEGYVSEKSKYELKIIIDVD